jgi:hypothetical protein
MEVAVNDNEEELVFPKHRDCREVKVIEALIIDMKSVYKITLLFGITILVSSCHNNAANYQYFPNMYEHIGYDTYSESSAFKNGKEGNYPQMGL